jgi:hypothetical protein
MATPPVTGGAEKIRGHITCADGSHRRKATVSSGQDIWAPAAGSPRLRAAAVEHLLSDGVSASFAKLQSQIDALTGTLRHLAAPWPAWVPYSPVRLGDRQRGRRGRLTWAQGTLGGGALPADGPLGYRGRFQ